jgi:uncharacterized protein (DUF2126 family)
LAARWAADLARSVADRGQALAGQAAQGDRCRAARDFLAATAVKLGVSADYAMPVYEDAVDWIVREAELPDNTDPLDPKLEDAEVRNRFMRTFQRG